LIPDRLRTLDATQPEARLQLAGNILFDLVYQLVKGERGARIKDFLAILGSVGGHACIVGALDTVARNIGKPAANQLVVLAGKDGNRYYFGDLPNEALLESPLSLLSLTLGAAQANGGSVSLEKVHDVMGHVASTAGTSEFGIPRIAGDHRPGDVPFNYIKHLRAKLFEGLDLYEVPSTSEPARSVLRCKRQLMWGRIPSTRRSLPTSSPSVQCLLPNSIRRGFVEGNVPGRLISRRRRRGIRCSHPRWWALRHRRGSKAHVA